jgi:hypothetical protein
MSRVAVPRVWVVLAACAPIAGAQLAWTLPAFAATHDALISKYSAEYGVPEPLVRRVIKVESRGRADLVNKGNYGLMQIRLGTARSMGYSGDGSGLLDPDTNMTYAVKYLAGAYRAAGCDSDRAVRLYQRGYYGRKHSACIAPAPDVIKPKVVQAELISKSKPEPVPMPHRAKFEPVRISSVSVSMLQPVPMPSPKPAILLAKLEAAKPEPITIEAAKPEIAKPEVAKLEVAKPEIVKPAETTAVAVLDTAAFDSVPLPRARPDIEPELMAVSKPAHHSGHKHVHAERKTDTGTADVPGAVVSFFKKITTPDKKPRRREARQQPTPSQNF